MSDLNILNRASFEDTELQVEAIVPPGQTTTVKHNLNPGQIFCLKEISWKYGVDNNLQDGYGWPRCGLMVTLDGAFKDRVESPYKASPPKILQQLEFKILNPSSLRVKLYFTLKGQLVSQRGEDPLSFKEILGYILLNDNQKGILALTEAFSSKNELSLDSILTSLAGGNLPAFSERNNLQLPNSKPIASLSDEESVISLMIGDLVTFQSNQFEPLKVDHIRELAKYLVSKHWNR